MGVLGVQWWQHQSNHNSTKVRASFSFDGSLATVRGLFCRRWRNVRVRGLFGPSGINGRVKGLLGVQWWQHQSNHNSTKVKAPFCFYRSLATVRGLFCSPWRNVRVRGLFGPSESNGRVMGLLGVQWWQHQSNHNSTKARAPFSFYGNLATVRGLFCSRWRNVRVRGLFGPSENNGRVMGSQKAQKAP